MSRRAPITRQRSRWEIVPRLDHELLPWPSTWYLRHVSDGLLYALVAEEPQIGWHMSISFRDNRGNLSRYPSWDEIAHARDELLLDDLEFVMFLPRSEDYVALHDTTFHLHEHPARGAAS